MNISISRIRRDFQTAFWAWRPIVHYGRCVVSAVSYSFALARHSGLCHDRIGEPTVPGAVNRLSSADVTAGLWSVGFEADGFELPSGEIDMTCDVCVHHGVV